MLDVMSKAFTKEESADDSIMVRARAPLPADVPNYVTARGLGLLERELHELEAERDTLERSTDEKQRQRLPSLYARITEVAARVHGTVLVDVAEDQKDEVRLGAHVTVRDGAGRERRYQIVGVDEANGAEGRLAFVAPVARALLGRRVGEITAVQTPRGEDELEIVAIDYQDEEEDDDGAAHS
jgi:transcription elongation factor GreB